MEESCGHHSSFSVASGQSQGANSAQRTTISVSKPLCLLEDKLCTFLSGVSQNPLVSLENPTSDGWHSHWQKPKQAVKHGSSWDALPGPSSQPQVCYHHRCPLRNLLQPSGERQLQWVPTSVWAPPFLSGWPLHLERHGHWTSGITLQSKVWAGRKGFSFSKCPCVQSQGRIPIGPA